MATSPAERVRAYRQRQKEKGEADSSRRWAKQDKQVSKVQAKAKLKPFVGCDGEGAGVDDLGRQNYLLFRMGERELFRDGERLTTEEILDFICDEPGGTILVGFAFGYDVTMILRDLPPKQLERLFADKEVGEGKSRYVWYRNFDIEYLPRQYFRVRRVSRMVVDGNECRKPVAGSARTIFETFGFFQKSFLKAIESFGVGTSDERDSIARDKARRAEFEGIGQSERDYCALECQFLAELMEKLRGYCHEAGIYPRSWNGAGKLAKALHQVHETLEATAVNSLVPEGAMQFSAMAYYGGRFEITRTGLIEEKVYQYDIRSAYPDAMRKLPCLVHGEWSYFEGVEPQDADLFVASCKFKHSDNGHAQLCGLPIRSKEGRLYWPLRGAGIYWSVEIKSARTLGAHVSVKHGWSYKRNCSCQPFDWVERLYDYRLSIGSSGPGYPIKLGINSLYGTLAQRIGNGKFANMLWAGLITAFTRSKIMDAIALAPKDILMVATDAVFSTQTLELSIGVRLGEWELEESDGLFVVQPGLYWSPNKRKRKSRGLPGKFFEEPGRTESFEDRWKYWCVEGGDIPSVKVPLTNFIGLRLALARGKPELAGTWINDSREISFDYRGKREGHIYRDGHIVTAPRPGSPGLVSLPHRDFLLKGGAEPWDNARAMLEDMPDYVDLPAPFEE